MDKPKFKFKKTQVFRHLIQLAAFFFMPGLFISAFSAVGDIYAAVIGGTFSISALSYQLLLVIAVFPVTALMGRFFCGYFCSFGAMGDLLWFISRKVRKKNITVSEQADRVLKTLKFVILGLIVVMIWTFGAVTVSSTADPWTIFGMYASVAGWPSAAYLLSAGAVLLLLIMVGSLFVERFFCRYLCPLGAIFSLISHIRLFRVSKPGSACGPCRLCTKKCAMGISLYRTDRVDSGECINCFQCVDTCPRRNVRVNPTPAVATAVASVAIAGLYYAGSLTADAASEAQEPTGTQIVTQVASAPSAPGAPSANSNAPAKSAAAASAAKPSAAGSAAAKTSPAEAASSAAPASSKSPAGSSAPASSASASSTGTYKDGVYTGTGTGFRGATKVSVTVSGGKITAVTIVSAQDDSKYLSRAKSSVISSILSKQSVNVATVSGATFSSNGILEAVANALSISFTSPNSSPARR